MRVAHAGPANADEQSAECEKDTRAKAIDQPAFDRSDPRLQKDEKRESPLNGRQRPVFVSRPHWGNEQGPCVLKVSYHNHSYDGASELNPTLAHTFFLKN